MLGLRPKPGLLLDGVSILPALLQKGPLKREAVFFHFPHPGVAPARFPATAVRQGKWKLIRCYCDGPKQADRFELYDLENDPLELDNLYSGDRGVVSVLSDRLAAWLGDDPFLAARQALDVSNLEVEEDVSFRGRKHIAGE